MPTPFSPPTEIGNADKPKGDHNNASSTTQKGRHRPGNADDNRSRLVPVVVEITAPYEMVGQRPPLVEGMFVQVIFRGTPRDEALVIPRAALRPNSEVWVITQDHKVTIRRVEVARAGLDEAVITAGLQPGEMVCTSNLQYVTEGLPVRLEGEPMQMTSKEGAE